MTALTPAQRRYLEAVRDTGAPPRTTGARGGNTVVRRRLVEAGLLTNERRVLEGRGPRPLRVPVTLPVLTDAGRAALEAPR